MPELPEVETVRRILENKINNKKIINVEILHDKLLRNIEKEDFINIITKQVVKSLDRNGKYLIFKLSDYFLVSHLRMEGKYFFIESQEEYNKIPNKKHILMCIYFEDGSSLYYHDVRKFGTIDLIEGKDELDYFFKKLGNEPWDVDIETFIKKVNKSNRKIKNILLDQSVIAGLGNIYVDEVLLKSKISPFTTGNMLDKKELENILINSDKTLKRAIELGGTTIRSYTSSLGSKGKYQNERVAYGMEGKPCYRCGNDIVKTKISGRGTYFCNNCQIKK